MAEEIIKEYTNGEVTVVWKPKTCIHAGNCVRGLGEVFQPKSKPWIKVDAANTERIVKQVKECPSGALSFYYNDASENEPETAPAVAQFTLKPNGPILFHGKCEITDADGNKTERENVTAFCRCGASENKPFCDGAHRKIDFKG